MIQNNTYVCFESEKVEKCDKKNWALFSVHGTKIWLKCL